MKRGKLFRSGQDGAAPSEGTGPGKSTGKGPDRLVEAGVVDRGFYEALTDRSFGSDRAAAKHFLREAGAGHSLHPLIDPTMLPGWVRDGLARGEAGALLRYLRGKGADRRLGPLFDSESVGTHAERTEHPGGALGLFLATADDQTPLPGHPDVTWGAARTALMERALLIGEQERHAGSRVLDDWDEDAEDVWRAEWAVAPLPESTDGGPLVSVVIPVRNRPRVIASALQSVSAQTLEDWELVVVDDGSTDETPQVLEQWAARDKRIRVVTQDWEGVSAARNRGLKEARGRYVAFLDSDNRWRPDFLRLAVAAMHGQGLRAAYAAMALHEDERTRYRAHPYTYDDLLVHNFVDPNVLVVERDLARDVGGFDEELRRWVDHDFALRLGRRVDLRLLPFVAVDYDASLTATERITTSESRSFQFVVLGRQWVDWDAVAGAVADRVPGRLSVIVPAHDDARLTRRAVRSVLKHTAGRRPRGGRRRQRLGGVGRSRAGCRVPHGEPGAIRAAPPRPAGHGRLEPRVRAQHRRARRIPLPPGRGAARLVGAAGPAARRALGPRRPGPGPERRRHDPLGRAGVPGRRRGTVFVPGGTSTGGRREDRRPRLPRGLRGGDGHARHRPRRAARLRPPLQRLAPGRRPLPSRRGAAGGPLRARARLPGQRPARRRPRSALRDSTTGGTSMPAGVGASRPPRTTDGTKRASRSRTTRARAERSPPRDRS